MLGDLFIFSTTQDNEPTLTNLNIVDVGPINTIGGQDYYAGPVTTITFATSHNLEVGQQLNITESNITFINGDFIVNNIISPTQIGIVTETAWGNSTSNPVVISPFGSEIITINSNGIGEIGVAQKNNNTQTWSYTRLLRSVELNFVSKNSIRCDGRQKIISSKLYFTDFYNPIRSFSYKGEYIEDGALSLNNSENIYSYDNINFETILFQISAGMGTSFSLAGVDSIGGELLAGNYYFFYRFYVENQAQYWGSLGTPVSIYLKDFPEDPPEEIVGNVSTTLTSKSIRLRLSEVNTNLYDEVEFAVIRASDTGFDSPIAFQRVDTTDTVDITFTNLEEDAIAVDVGSLALESLSVSVPYQAYDLSIVDGRLVLGNIKYKKLADLEDWAKSITHKLIYKDIGISPIRDKDIYESYVKPEIINEYPQLTLNETYRFGVEVIFQDGVKSPVYWVDDVKIDCNSINSANPYSDNRRSSGLPNFELSGDINTLEPNNTETLKIPHIVFDSLNLSFRVGGIPLERQVAEIRFRMAEIKKEVLASGFVVLGTEGYRVSQVAGDSDSAVDFEVNTNGNIVPNPSFFGWYKPNDSGFPVWNPSEIRYPFFDTNTPTNPFIANIWEHYRKYAFFYSPEILNGELDDFALTGADRLNILYPLKRTGDDVLGNIASWQPGGPNSPTDAPTSLDAREDIFVDYVAKSTLSSSAISVNQYDINYYTLFDYGAVPENIDPTSPNEEISNRYNQIITAPDVTTFNALLLEKCMAFKVDQDIYPADIEEIPSEQEKDIGIYYAQLFREFPNKYGDIESTIYTSQYYSHSIEKIKENNFTAPSFFGDSFSFRNIHRHQWAEAENIGGAVGLSQTCQSYMNTALLAPKETVMFFDDEPLVDWLGEIVQYETAYNHAYDYEFPIKDSVTFNDSIAESLSDAPARIVYSVRDNYSSVVDNMRNLPPASFKDLDGTWGAIFSVNNINGELFTIQPRKYQLQYFNTRGTLQGSNSGVSVLIGDSSVLSRDGQTLSSYGTFHSESVIKGTSAGGKDVIYWFNQENGLFMRFGADGTIVLSDRNGMRSFSANNTMWTENNYTHALNYGIRSVWDDRFKEAIWTFIGIRETRGNWTDSGEKYVVGDIVVGSTTNNYPLDDIPDLYVCIENNNSSEGTEPGNGSTESGRKWKAIAKDDPEYYSVFTLAFNELSNGFSTFYSHIPKTYMKWSNKFLSSNPLHRSELYEHRYGYDKWYEYEGVWKESEPFVEGVVNLSPDQSKKFIAMQSMSDNAPDKIELTTKEHESFLVADDFSPEDDAWRSPIKNDILTSSTLDPNDDTASLVGSYMRVKFKFFNGTYNKLNNLIIKIRARLRRIGS